jgi:hypothetical protein
MSLLEKFSGGYYRAQMEVQPFENGPAIEQGLYDIINRRVYDTTDAPVTMRLGLNSGPRFVPSAERSMPKDVIGVPKSILDESNTHPADTNVNVFVLKPQAAYRFNKTMDPSGHYCYDEDGGCQLSDNRHY